MKDKGFGGPVNKGKWDLSTWKSQRAIEKHNSRRNLQRVKEPPLKLSSLKKKLQRRLKSKLCTYTPDAAVVVRGIGVFWKVGLRETMGNLSQG